MSFGGVALGCGNFGGIGSAPEFFGQGIDDERRSRSWTPPGRRAPLVRHRRRLRGRHERALIGEWRADAKPDGLVLTTKVFHSTRGEAGDVGLAPDRIRRQLEAASRAWASSGSTSTSRTSPTRRAARVRRSRRSRAAREGLIGAWGLSNYDADGVREALEVAQPAIVQNSFSLLDRGDERDVIPLCAERGIAYVPFGPLSGGWLTGKYRRDEAFPDGSRMTQRPGPYEHLRDDAVFDGLDRLGEKRASAASTWHACVRLGARSRQRRGLRPDARRASRAGPRRARARAHRRRHQRIGGFFA